MAKRDAKRPAKQLDRDETESGALQLERVRLSEIGAPSGSNANNGRDALTNLKYEIAAELGITLKPGYNGELSARQAGLIGGQMVKRLIEQAKRSHE